MLNLDALTLSEGIALAKRITAIYDRNHKGRNRTEKECLRKGYIVRRVENGKLGVFALEFNTIYRHGELVLIR